MQDVYLYQSIRTPFAKYAGVFSHVRPDDMLADTFISLAKKSPGLDLEQIEEIIVGNANGAGEENRNLARMSTLLAGFPTHIPGTTVNRLCGSGMDAAIMASRAIRTGDMNLTIAAGAESMTRAPYVQLKPERNFSTQPKQMESTTLGWRLINPSMPKDYRISLGEATERLREHFNISREDQDRFASRSHTLAAQAWENGFYDDLVMTGYSGLNRDESIRPDSTADQLAQLQPAFRKTSGTLTAGNSSGLNDGAAAMFIGSQNAAQQLGGEPTIRVRSAASHAVDPWMFGIAPVEAANKALQQAGITWNDVSFVELNEAFAAQSLACIQQWPFDAERVNIKGGAIALGHPLGASGIRIISTLAKILTSEKRRYGVAAICIGVGQGQAVVLENMESSQRG